MSDKTPLERDIEIREMVRTPFIVKLIIVLLCSGLFVVTLYAFMLKQELINKEQKIMLMQEKYRNEQSILHDSLKNLRTRLKSEDKDGDQTD